MLEIKEMYRYNQYNPATKKNATCTANTKHANREVSCGRAIVAMI